MSRYLHSEEQETKEYTSRYKLLYAILALSSIIVFSRLWYLQVIQGKELRDYSDKNRVKETKIPAPRGFILDRHGEILVQNLPGFSVTISPQYATKLEDTAREVSEVLQLPPEKIVEMVHQSRRQNGPFRPVTIKENLSLDEVSRLKMVRFHHPGLNIKQTILRHYALNENGAQLFGYVGEISKAQIERYSRRYPKLKFEQGDVIGKSGLEEVWEEQIRGASGLSFVEVDARGRESATSNPSFLGVKAYKAKPGLNLILTIDRDLQTAAYKAMNREDTIGPRIGSVVAIKTNGEVLAWVNTPSFNPNEFSRGISNELWSQLINDPYKPLRNKVIQDHYSPGSTFKPLVSLAALQEKVVEPNTLVYCPGFIRFGRRPYHDHTRYGQGDINIVEAIERSSNTFFYKMGIALGIDKIYNYAHLLGIGEKTNINLANEVSGLMPNAEWKKRVYGEDWQPGENLVHAIGQGFVLTTALQMALAYSAIGTEGLLYKPFLVKKMMDHNNNVIVENEPELVRDLTNPEDGINKIEKKYFKVVKEGMRRVVNGDKGTARGKKLRYVEYSGKTGTAQVKSYSADQIYDKCSERAFDERHNGWFVAFAPSDKPEIAVAVMAEHSCSGSQGAAPVARDIIDAYFHKYHPELVNKKVALLESPNEN